MLRLMLCRDIFIYFLSLRGIMLLGYFCKTIAGTE